jgi:UDP-N-acetylmuramoyl-L-alanyl-D-glutamate--2,6-diaminopimelate ligase
MVSALLTSRGIDAMPMELTKLINSVHAIQVSGEIERKDISDIISDSRKVIKGCVFVAIKGLKSDGHDYILDAISKGATVIVLDKNIFPEEIFLHRNVAKIFVADSRIALAELSNAFYKQPSELLQLHGVTGTKGKTTTTWLLRHIIRAAGQKAGMLGTIANYIDDEILPASLTTPESNDLCAMLYDMSRRGCEAAVMEVSSHALALNRVYGLSFRSAVFTNLTLDHLDYHGTFENYRDAKKMLFDNLADSAIAVVNADDENAAYMASSTKAAVYTYGQHTDADFRIENLKISLSGTEFTISYKGQVFNVITSLFGAFNASNCAAAFAVAFLQGIPAETILDALKTAAQVPGRFEMYAHDEKSVVVDYAHTPDSLEKTLQNIRAIIGTSRPLITVFGCGGNRDTSKRPIMGRIAAELSDEVIVTSDNPRMEDPEEIIKEIVTGITSENYRVISDRRKAIAESIQASAPDAVILVAGKGHEDYQIIGDKKFHFSDREEVLDALHMKEKIA